MRKAFLCAAFDARVYLRSGKIILPLLALIGYPLIFYAIVPVDVVGSFSMSCVVVFAVCAWLGLSRAWAEDVSLAQILSVKVGYVRFAAAQEIVTTLLCAACGLFIVAFPLIWSAGRQGFFTRALTAGDVLSALSLNGCAAIAGGAWGGLFHPRLLRDRKLAYTLCVLTCLMGLTGGMAGFPVAVRVFLPPLYDCLIRAGKEAFFPEGYAARMCAWFLAFALTASAARTSLLTRRKF